MIKYLIFFMFYLIGACNAPHKNLHLGNENNGQQIKISQKDGIILELEANPTTGYTWSISNIDTNIIKQIQQVEFKASSKKLGAPGKQIFRIQAVAVGQTNLRLIYHRPWEKGVAPIDTFDLKITVKK